MPDNYRTGQNFRNNNQRNDAEIINQEVKDFYKKAVFNPQWIKSGADPDLVTFAETMGRYMATENLTNSKIRSIYGEIKRIQMGEFENEKSSFYLLKPKVAYALGRDKTAKGLQLFKLMFDEASSYVTGPDTFQNFCNLIEAILAYHRAYTKQ